MPCPCGDLNCLCSGTCTCDTHNCSCGKCLSLPYGRRRTDQVYQEAIIAASASSQINRTRFDVPVSRSNESANVDTCSQIPGSSYNTGERISYSKDAKITENKDNRNVLLPPKKRAPYRMTDSVQGRAISPCKSSSPSKCEEEPGRIFLVNVRNRLSELNLMEDQAQSIVDETINSIRLHYSRSSSRETLEAVEQNLTYDILRRILDRVIARFFPEIADTLDPEISNPFESEIQKGLKESERSTTQEGGEINMDLSTEDNTRPHFANIHSPGILVSNESVSHGCKRFNMQSTGNITKYSDTENWKRSQSSIKLVASDSHTEKSKKNPKLRGILKSVADIIKEVNEQKKSSVSSKQSAILHRESEPSNADQNASTSQRSEEKQYTQARNKPGTSSEMLKNKSSTSTEPAKGNLKRRRSVPTTLPRVSSEEPKDKSSKYVKKKYRRKNITQRGVCETSEEPKNQSSNSSSSE